MLARYPGRARTLPAATRLGRARSSAARRASPQRFRGPLADSYPAAVAPVVFALIPYLALSSAMTKLVPVLLWLVAASGAVALLFVVLTFEDPDPQDRTAPWDRLALTLAGGGCATALSRGPRALEPPAAGHDRVDTRCAGALLAVCLFVLGRARFDAPDLEQPEQGEQPAWDSPALVARLRHQPGWLCHFRPNRVRSPA